MAKRSIDWTSATSGHVEAITSDVIAPSPWEIFGCQNGNVPLSAFVDQLMVVSVDDSFSNNGMLRITSLQRS